ncbi:hypothetical protein TNCV_888111 [Trichonephila clavipes]|nr:hypothetical protein TNCV_888111 [Trichonephila clavipes]
MAGLWPYSGSQVMLECPVMRDDQKAKQGAESSQLEVPLTLKRAKSMLPHTLTNILPRPKNQEPCKVMGNPG